MELFQAINQRHSYRGNFKNIKISDEDLKKIVSAGIKAPSGHNSQTTEFIIVTKSDLINKIAEILHKNSIKTATAIIMCITEKLDVYHGMSFYIEDCAAATENILLAVTALGYATVWIEGELRTEKKRVHLKKLLSIPDKKTVQIVLPIGIPKSKGKQADKKNFDERAWFNGYKNI